MKSSRCIKDGWLAAALVATLGLAAPAAAGETDNAVDAAFAQAHEGAQEEAHGQATENEAHGEHAEHAKNGLTLFLGGTVETAENETYFTIGGEYERKLADRWGVQVVVEHVNDCDAWVVVAPVGFRVVDKLWFTAGPGFETAPRRPGHEEHNGGHEPDPHGDEHAVEPFEEGTDTFFLWRFGLGYSIHLNESWGLMPSANLDLVHEHGEWVEAWVLGVGITYHF